MTKRLRAFGVREQAAWMRAHHKDFSTTVAGRTFRTTGRLRPTPSSRLYSVSIVYEAGERPHAYVADLQIRPGASRIPHTYSPKEPCLFYPPGREWQADMTIATTIVPWLSLWLYYYEVWLATGDWVGGGITHEPKLEGDVSHS